MAKNKYLSPDGLLDTVAVKELGAEIEREVTKGAGSSWRRTGIYYFGKRVPDYDPQDGTKTVARRLVEVKKRTKMPKLGSTVKMAILVNVYKDADFKTMYGLDLEEVLSAITTHNERVVQRIGKVKAGAKEQRVKDEEKFIRSVKAVTRLLTTDAAISEKNIVVATSQTGVTTVQIRVGKDLYITVGKSDAARFERAVNPPPPSKPFGRKD